MSKPNRNNNNKSGNKSGTRNNRPRPGCGHGRNRKKEVEVNVEDKAINMGDIPHVITGAAKSNDPSWYTHGYPMVADVASLAFNIPVGTGFNPLNAGTPAASLQTTINAKSIPGIMAFDVMPTVGVSTNSTSAPNMAAQQLYSKVRAANSGRVNYDKTDLMMMIMAMDSAYMVYEWLLRGYRTFGVYNTMSRYQPSALLTAMGFSPSLATELADFRAMLDLFAYKLGSINVPNQFDFIKRHSWMFTNVFVDNNVDTAQMYLYNPKSVFVWTEGTESKPTYLKCENLSGLLAGWPVTELSQIQNLIDAIMEPLLGSGDIGIISGDLEKTFGSNGMIKIMPVADNEVIKPVYDEEALTQLMNADVFVDPASDYWSNFDIKVNYQDTISGPYLISRPVVGVTATDNSDLKRYVKHMLNYINVQPSPDYNMVATRLMAIIGPKESNGNFAFVQSCGTELCVGASIYISQIDQNNNIIGYTTYNFHSISNMADPDARNLSLEALRLAALSTFDWHPTRYMITSPITGTGGPVFSGYIQDICKYVLLEDSTVENMNTVAVMSEFYAQSFESGLKI